MESSSARKQNKHLNDLFKQWLNISKKSYFTKFQKQTCVTFDKHSSLNIRLYRIVLTCNLRCSSRSPYILFTLFKAHVVRGRWKVQESLHTFHTLFKAHVTRERWKGTLEYTPGYARRPHPIPKLTAPTTYHFPVPAWYRSGPPESP